MCGQPSSFTCVYQVWTTFSCVRTTFLRCVRTTFLCMDNLLGSCVDIHLLIESCTVWSILLCGQRAVCERKTEAVRAAGLCCCRRVMLITALTATRALPRTNPPLPVAVHTYPSTARAQRVSVRHWPHLATLLPKGDPSTARAQRVCVQHGHTRQHVRSTAHHSGVVWVTAPAPLQLTRRACASGPASC